MMKTKYRNVAFLAELLINILVFSIACAVLVGLFGKAGEIAKTTREKSLAGTEVNAVAEAVKAGGLEKLGANTADGTAILLYTAEWQETTNIENASYKIVVSVQYNPTGAGTLTDLEVRAYPCAEGADATENELYGISTSTYQPF